MFSMFKSDLKVQHVSHLEELDTFSDQF